MKKGMGNFLAGLRDLEEVFKVSGLWLFQSLCYRRGGTERDLMHDCPDQFAHVRKLENLGTFIGLSKLR